MCGIISITGNSAGKINDSNLSSMLTSLSKRGPNDSGILKFPKCTLGQTRLAIIDLESGHQPMKDNVDDVAITFNGEVYNYKEQRKKLEALGHKFTTSSDTEVILKSYIEYGTECLKYLDGMFVFSIWDNKKQELFFARDRFGKKPLYYTFDTDGNIILASEIKALFASGIPPQKLNHKAIDHYLTLMYIPPSESIYEDVFPVLPAHAGVFKNNQLKMWRYWELKYNPITIEYEEAKKRIKELLDNAVKKRMIADVEIGSFLSGGVDSTLITHIAQKYSKKPIQTFSVGYGEHINELPFAKEASKTIGTNHHSLEVAGDFIGELKSVIEYLDEPHADSANIAQHLVSQLTSKHVKVALTGDGADELFMGYGWYWRHKYLSFRHDTIEKLFLNPFTGFTKIISIFSKKERKKLWIDSSYLSTFPTPIKIIKNVKNAIGRINVFDLSVYLPGQLLTKIDRTGMMNSLEVRSPFLDTELAEFVFNLPVEYKTKDGNGKIILKDILNEIMPNEFVNRRKQGFGAPVKEWLKKESFKKDIYAKLKTSEAEIYKIMNKEFIKYMLDEFYIKGNDKYYYKIWVIYCLESWFVSHKQFIKY